MHDSITIFIVTSLFGVRGLRKLVGTTPRIGKVLALSVLVGLAGCASHEKLAVASGPTFPLNPDHWQATAADLTAPDAGK